MGFVGGLLGTGGGAAGTGFGGPISTDIQRPTTNQQATDAYTANQNALAQQQAFLNALQGQNGIQNQSSVFNQLQGVANGTGPNPAQAMLNNTTGANIANQAALMAGQRGSGANVGLIARQAANQGANTQQQAAGQGAALQAQQSLGALNQLGGIAGQQVGQQQQATGQLTSAQQAEQQMLLNSIAQQNNAAVGMQSNVNNANTNLAGTVMGQQGQLLGNLTGGGGSAMQLMAAEGGEVPGQRQMYADGMNVQQINPEMLSYNPVQPIQPNKSAGPQSKTGQHFASQANGQTQMQPQGYAAVGSAIRTGLQNLFHTTPTSDANPSYGNTYANDQGIQNQGGGLSSDAAQALMEQQDKDAASEAAGQEPRQMAEGGRVPALVSPGEQYLPPKDVKKVAKGANPLAVGERIPGKPKFPGNDYRNDTVKKSLQSGGIVIPNEVMQSRNPHFEAMKFVHAHIAKHRGQSKKSK